jgi:hypothetical protein
MLVAVAVSANSGVINKLLAGNLFGSFDLSSEWRYLRA